MHASILKCWLEMKQFGSCRSITGLAPTSLGPRQWKTGRTPSGTQFCVPSPFTKPGFYVNFPSSGKNGLFCMPRCLGDTGVWPDWGHLEGLSYGTPRFSTGCVNVSNHGELSTCNEPYRSHDQEKERCLLLYVVLNFCVSKLPGLPL